jgi:capsular polysaccharide transport system permease protein
LSGDSAVHPAAPKPQRRAKSVEEPAARRRFIVEDDGDERDAPTGLADDEADVSIRARPVRPPHAMTMEGLRQRRRRSMLISLAFLVLPIVIGGIYLYFFFPDIYEVPTVLMIKMPATPDTGGGSGGSSGSSGGSGGLSALMSGGGGGSPMTRAQDESYATVPFIQSREAFRELDRQIDFRKHFSGPNIDWFHRLDPHADFETAYRYYMRNVDIYYDDIQGQVLLTTYAFDADTASRMAQILTTLCEQLVNEFNERAQRDFLALAHQDVDNKRAQLVKTFDEITDFRRKNEVIDPGVASTAYDTIIGTLLSQAATTQASITALGKLGLSSSTAQAQPLRVQLESLAEQVQKEQQKQTGKVGALAPTLAQYGLLQTDLSIVQQEYSNSLANYDTAIFQAARQKLYAVEVVKAFPPNEPQIPLRWWDMLLLIGGTIIAWVVMRIVVAAIRDHMA